MQKKNKIHNKDSDWGVHCTRYMRHSNYQPTPNFLLSLRSSAWTIFPVVRPRANKQTKKNPTSALFSKTTRDGKRIVFPLRWSLKRRSLVGGSCPISQTLAPDLSFRVRLRRRGYIYRPQLARGKHDIILCTCGQFQTACSQRFARIFHISIILYNSSNG